MILSTCAVHAGDVNIEGMSISDCDNINLQTENQSPEWDLEYKDPIGLEDSSLADNAKNHTELTALTNEVYDGGNYTVCLKDSNTNSPLEGKTVIFTVNDVNYTSKTDSGGIAAVNLNLGTYSVTAYFDGEDAYDSSSLTSRINVLPTVKTYDLIKYYKGTAKYTATFYDSQGNALANKMVNIIINGKKYSKKTNAKGAVALNVNLKPGTYSASADNPATGYHAVTSIKIRSTIASSDLKKVAGDSKKFTAKFYKSNGKVLSKQYIKFKINGKTYNVRTNSKGQASLSLNNLKKGTYEIISYNRDGLSQKNTVKIYKIANTKLDAGNYYCTFLPGDVKKIKIKFATSLADSSKSGKTVKIKIDGKTYSKKTDSNGVIDFNLASFKKGLYKVVYSYAGNKFFKSSKTSSLVTILDTAEPKLTVKSSTRFGYGAGSLFKVALTAGGVPLIKRTMTFSIDGQNYSSTTDNSGIASVPINLKIGKYTVGYKTNSKFGINGTSASSGITVFERNNCSIVWKCGNSFKDSSQIFKILLTDSKGKPISGGNIELTVDGETYFGKTSSDGYATIRAYAPYGPYSVQVEFTGSNNFLPNSISHSISVKLSQFGSGLNTKNTVSALSKYLKSSKHSPVNNAKIKSLVNSLTKGLTNKIEKAKAIYNFVRDDVWYEYYYNTHKGAVGAMNTRGGNCVDQAHLLIAMFRTAGFAARYVHGTCRFSDGTFGHVWTQVLIGNTWVVADPISYRNNLGQINNWNVNTYSLHSRYLSLPF